MTGNLDFPRARHGQPITIEGACVALGPEERTWGVIEIGEGRITRISRHDRGKRAPALIDLTGYLVMPGLINAHDHLEFSLYPPLAHPPHRNYIDWGDDIHRRFPGVIAKQHAMPRSVRLWWGGIRNLLCGVTTVCHHDPLWPELRRPDFPVRVAQEYGWAHSLALGGDLPALRRATPASRPFIVHACEGVDEVAGKELWELNRLGVVDAGTVLVHGLAIGKEGITLLNDRKASLIVCPSSNCFLFGLTPEPALFTKVGRVALGNDSPLTAAGDLLDEIRFTIDRCEVSPQAALRMVTSAPATMLRLENGEGAIRESGFADLIAVRDSGATAAETLRNLSAGDVEFVMIGGQVQLASQPVLERLPRPLRQGLEPISVGGVARCLRAPVRRLLSEAEAILGENGVRLSGRTVSAPASVTASYVY